MHQSGWASQTHKRNRLTNLWWTQHSTLYRRRNAPLGIFHPPIRCSCVAHLHTHYVTIIIGSSSHSVNVPPNLSEHAQMHKLSCVHTLCFDIREEGAISFSISSIQKQKSDYCLWHIWDAATCRNCENVLSTQKAHLCSDIKHEIVCTILPLRFVFDFCVE